MASLKKFRLKILKITKLGQADGQPETVPPAMAVASVKAYGCCLKHFGVPEGAGQNKINVLNSSARRCSGQYLLQFMHLICLYKSHFFLPMANAVIIIEECRGFFETIKAHGVVQPSNLTRWTTAGRRAMLIQLGLRLLLANVWPRDREMDKMGQTT